MADVRDRFQSLGIDVAASSPDESASFTNGNALKWRKIVKDSDAEVN